MNIPIVGTKHSHYGNKKFPLWELSLYFTLAPPCYPYAISTLFFHPKLIYFIGQTHLSLDENIYLCAEIAFNNEIRRPSEAENQSSGETRSLVLGGLAGDVAYATGTA